MVFECTGNPIGCDQYYAKEDVCLRRIGEPCPQPKEQSQTEPSSLADGGSSEAVGEVKNCPKCGMPENIVREDVEGSEFECGHCGHPYPDHIEGDEVSLKEGIP